MSKSSNWKKKYEFIEKLGKGGNAEVFKVRCKSNNTEYALKKLNICKFKTDEKKRRFVYEINVMKDNCSETSGIIPILDYSTDEYWYIMPIAKTIINNISENELDIKAIVSGVIQLCETLEKLHAKAISHRDIKPANIYFYENRFCFGDFGLVDFPEKTEDFTKSDRGLGAIFTIAPEMKRDPKNADGKKADVFSLAKTLWMFLTKDERGFDGVYTFLDRTHALRYNEKYKEVFISKIEELLKDATDNDPENRPSIVDFKNRLTEWLEIESNHKKSYENEWEFLNKCLFGSNGSNSAESSTWKDINKIINILNTIKLLPQYNNHLLFSGKGGFDFEYAELANEKDCIYLYTSGYCNIVKPKCLYFEVFDKDPSWNYFLLELDKLEPILGQPTLEYEYEMLVEDYPAHYVSDNCVKYGVYDYESGEPLPNGYKIVARYLSGKIMIVLKTGQYNNSSSTYDGRHGKLSNLELRAYISKLIEFENTLKNKGLDTNKYDIVRIYDDDIKKNSLVNNKKTHKVDDNDTAKNTNPEQFIIDNHTTWNFSSCFSEKEVDKGNISFYFKFENNVFFSSKLRNEKKYLCEDGCIKEVEENNFDNDIYLMYSRDEAIKVKEKCEEYIAINCIKGGYDKPKNMTTYFSICLKKIGKPTHLFTKNEIEELMRNADDRTDNTLVIDENGCVKIIHGIESYFLYPVKYETWHAGNNYVGKYSKLDTLDQTYISSLQAWFKYLEYGRKQGINYHSIILNEEELIKEIRKYY